jgi:cysteine desulfurase
VAAAATEVYLDNAATTPALPEVAAAVSEALLHRFGNPSSAHRWGIAAEGLLREARGRVAALMGAEPEAIVFTSGGTEANNLAVWGLAQARRRQGGRLVTTAIEHSSLLAACQAVGEALGWEVVRLAPDPDGVVPVERVVAAAAVPGTALVAIGHVNNEIGSVQPVAEVAAALRRIAPRPALHVDAVQSLGKLPLRLRVWGVDTCAVSAHKIHGPKGVGALYVRPGTRLVPLLRGGDQQGGLRPGTENVPGIAGFGVAAELCAADAGAAARMAALKRRLWQGIAAAVPGAAVNGPAPDAGAPHILNVRFPGLPAEVLLHALEARGVACSAGSACHARRPQPSHVLLALGLPAADVGASLRFSLSRLTTADEVDAAVAAIAAAAAELAGVVARR